jgi:hypothetical protein
MKEGKRKVLAFYWATLLGLVAFIYLVMNMPKTDLVTLCQFFFLYTGIITSGFFGFNFGEHFTNALASKYTGLPTGIKDEVKQ